jgi:hypothetical protein
LFFEPGSAGTLSDDGGGDGEPLYNSSTIAEQFTNAYYSVPGAWEGGTRTNASETSSTGRAQTQTWSEFVEETGDPWPSNDEYGGYDSDEYLTETESAELSSGHLDDSEYGSDQERDGVQSQLTRATFTPYCQRCNREFSTLNGLHQHHRMSSMHPWYCGTCKLDHDRELDLQVRSLSIQWNNELITSFSYSIMLPPFMRASLSPEIDSNARQPRRHQGG